MTEYSIQTYALLIVLLPLIGGLLAGLVKPLGKWGAHSVTILGVALSFILALYLCYQIVWLGEAPLDTNIYTWGISGHFQFSVGFLIDRLTTMMWVVVTFVSLAVHVYSIGYMQDDPGYQRFFSYISLFTFAMLTLVGANNFMQLYFGWEGVGLVSYLLIGFWFKRDSANVGSLKAFIVNRVGDFGFLLGIAVAFNYLESVDYATVFANAQTLSHQTMSIFPNSDWSVASVISILLFIGAMGKSAQVPLHVWLPESMEGPTPISALIHAATMVTAGVFMVTRMSPLFEYSSSALSLILIIGSTGALFTGLIAIVQNDIKRIVAYSTLSQLGYMMAGLGASAYAAGMFHLITHACFKALLFLAAGSVIIAMHHEQDIRKMGGLWKRMPVTYVTFLIGALALAAIPPFAGFYSKDAIIEAVHLATTPGATYAYYCVLGGTFVTAFYIFRAFFLVFHTAPRMDEATRAHIHESPWVVWLPLVVLAIPSAVIGAMLVQPMLYQQTNLFGNSIFVMPGDNPLLKLATEFRGWWDMADHAFATPPFLLSLAGIISAWVIYVKLPLLAEFFANKFSWIYRILVNKYGFDAFNQKVLVRGTATLSEVFYQVGDVKILDDKLVNGSGRFISWCSAAGRKLQSGYLYHYAFVMVIGIFALLAWLLFF